jgi:hypothetical protein
MRRNNGKASHMATTTTSARREVHYESLDEFRADAERLGSTTLRTVGNWTYPQILDHLAKSITASVDGFGFKAPWVARVFIAPLVKNAFLTKPMRPGFRLPRSATAIMPGSDLNVSTALDNLHRALARYENEPQRAPHPLLGMLASQEYTSMHLRHCELHMSFAVPDETA